MRRSPGLSCGFGCCGMHRIWQTGMNPQFLILLLNGGRKWTLDISSMISFCAASHHMYEVVYYTGEVVQGGSSTYVIGAHRPYQVQVQGMASYINPDRLALTFLTLGLIHKIKPQLSTIHFCAEANERLFKTQTYIYQPTNLLPIRANEQTTQPNNNNSHFPPEQSPQKCPPQTPAANPPPPRASPAANNPTSPAGPAKPSKQTTAQARSATRQRPATPAASRRRTRACPRC